MRDVYPIALARTGARSTHRDVRCRGRRSLLSSRRCSPPTQRSYRALPQLKLRAGEDGADLRFESLGYAEAALASYRVFGLLKRDGVVPRGCRFQVCLPTPLAPISAFVALDDQAVVEPAYE